jgi:hypothetical protein
MRAWSDTEILMLRDSLELDSDADAGAILGRTPAEIVSKRRELRLPYGRVLDELRKAAEAQ